MTSSRCCTGLCVNQNAHGKSSHPGCTADCVRPQRWRKRQMATCTKLTNKQKRWFSIVAKWVRPTERNLPGLLLPPPCLHSWVLQHRPRHLGVKYIQCVQSHGCHLPNMQRVCVYVCVRVCVRWVEGRKRCKWGTVFQAVGGLVSDVQEVLTCEHTRTHKDTRTHTVRCVHGEGCVHS